MGRWGLFDGYRINSYETEISYGPTGNILSKNQLNTGYFEDEDETVTIDETTYNYTYGYDTYQPHAVTSAGPKRFSYDLNGNMTTMVDSEKGLTRSVTWNNENRITKTQDSYAAKTVTTDYSYDASGTRVRKSGIYGTTLYVNNGYTIKDGELEGVHVFAGNTRLVSKMILHEKEDGKETKTTKGIWYYHPDHLGSSNVVTNRDGDFYEQIEYFPYGETWVHNKASETGYTTPYKFTGKEQDVETGLIYFGARYYDARLGRWTTVDPPLVKGEYLPKPSDFDNEHDMYWYTLNDKTNKLPGMGGVFNPVNLNAYQYAGNNPVVLVDPDGNAVFMFTLKGEAAAGYGKQGNVGIAIQFGMNTEFKAYIFSSNNTTAGHRIDGGVDVNFVLFGSFENFLDSDFITISGDYKWFGGGMGFPTKNGFNGLINISFGLGAGVSYGILKDGVTNYLEINEAARYKKSIMENINNYFKGYRDKNNEMMKKSIDGIMKDIKTIRENIKNK